MNPLWHEGIRKIDAGNKIFERGRTGKARIISHAKRGIPHRAIQTVPQRREQIGKWGEASDEASFEVLVFAYGFGALACAGTRPAVRGSLLRSRLFSDSPRQHEGFERQVGRFGQTRGGGAIVGRQRVDAGERGACIDDDRTGLGAVLWRARAAQEHACHHDAELRDDGADHGAVGSGRL